MSKDKNPFTKGFIPYNIWQSGYLEGKLEAWQEVTRSMPSLEECKDELQKRLELMLIKGSLLR